MLRHKAARAPWSTRTHPLRNHPELRHHQSGVHEHPQPRAPLCSCRCTATGWRGPAPFKARQTAGDVDGAAAGDELDCSSSTASLPRSWCRPASQRPSAPPSRPSPSPRSRRTAATHTMLFLYLLLRKKMTLFTKMPLGLFF